MPVHDFDGLSDDDLVGELPAKPTPKKRSKRRSKRPLDDRIKDFAGEYSGDYKAEGLSIFEARFVYNVLEGQMTYKKAAEKAGYTDPQSPRTLMARPHIKAALQRGMQEYKSRVRSSLEEVIAELAKIAFADTKSFTNKRGEVIPVHKLDGMAAAAVREFDVTTEDLGGNIKSKTTKVRLHDKKAALDSLARIYGGFTDKVQITGKNEGPVEHKVTMTAEEAYLAMIGK